MSIAKEYGCALYRSDLATTDVFYCGTEYEIEGIKKVQLPGFDPHCAFNDETPYWIDDIGLMKDGSLRNNGIEFVTRPVTYERSLELFAYLHDNLILGENPYSHRTSTHVHVNVASMSLEQIRAFILMYALVEPVFFSLTPGREHNIHCVPLNYTLLPTMYSQPISFIIDKWSKYTAFNLLPMISIGTIEFRHLYGTGDYQVYKQWLTLLRELWTAAKTLPYSILHDWVVQGVSYQTMRNTILPSAWNIVVPEEQQQTALIDVKLAFV